MHYLFFLFFSEWKQVTADLCYMPYTSLRREAWLHQDQSCQAGSEQSSMQAAAQGMKQTAKAAHGARAFHCPSACGETEARAVGVNYQTLQSLTLTYSCFLLGHTTTLHSWSPRSHRAFPSTSNFSEHNDKRQLHRKEKWGTEP